MNWRHVTDSIRRNGDTFFVLACGHHILAERGVDAYGRLQPCTRCRMTKDAKHPPEKVGPGFWWRGKWRPEMPL